MNRPPRPLMADCARSRLRTLPPVELARGQPHHAKESPCEDSVPPPPAARWSSSMTFRSTIPTAAGFIGKSCLPSPSTPSKWYAAAPPTSMDQALSAASSTSFPSNAQATTLQLNSSYGGQAPPTARSRHPQVGPMVRPGQRRSARHRRIHPRRARSARPHRSAHQRPRPERRRRGRPSVP